MAYQGKHIITDQVRITSTAPSTGKSTGALVVDGGVGIKGTLTIGQTLAIASGATVTGMTPATVGIDPAYADPPANLPISTAMQTALDKTVKTAQIGVATDSSTGATISGVCPLDTNRMVDTGYLPGFFDKVVPLADTATIFAQLNPASNNVYYAIAEQKQYRWTGVGTAYIELVSGVSVSDKTMRLNKQVQIALTGDVDGEVLFDGFNDVKINVNVHDDSHDHSKYEQKIVAGKTTDYFRGDKTWHSLDKAAIGLGNVANLAPAEMPISNDVRDELSAKAPIANPNFTGTVTGITKAMVGLTNVDNTSDKDKPVSTATQTVLDKKINIDSIGIRTVPNKDGSITTTGICPLDDLGHVDAKYIPNNVDKVKRYNTKLEMLALTGDDLSTNYIYVVASTPPTVWRWTGTASEFIEITKGTGNADSATKLATTRKIELTGIVTGSVLFDGSTNVALKTAVAGKSTECLMGDGTWKELKLDNITLPSGNSASYLANDLPVSAATQSALDNKADKTDLTQFSTFMSNMGQVENTKDIDKVISTATNIALGNKINKDTIHKPDGVAGLNGDGHLYLDQIPGITISSIVTATDKTSFPATGDSATVYVAGGKTYRYTINGYIEVGPGTGTADYAISLQTAREIKLDGEVKGSAFFDGRNDIVISTDIDIAGGDSTKYLRGDKTWTPLNKSAIGLSNVDNKSPADLPVSTATQTELDKKANLSGCTFTGPVSGITAAMIGLGNVENTVPNDYPISSKQQSEFDKKIDKDKIGDNTDAAGLGVCPLNEYGRVDSDYLTQYIDRVEEYDDLAAINALTDDKKNKDIVYFAKDTDKVYRYTGSEFINITSGGTADAAFKLYNAQRIKLTGVVTGAVSFNGTADVDLVTSIKAGGNSTDYLGGDGGWHQFDKSLLNLPTDNLINYTTATLPQSTATTNALALKAPLANPAFTGTVSGITKDMIVDINNAGGLDQVDNTSDMNKPISTLQQAEFDKKINQSQIGVKTTTDKAGIVTTGICPLGSDGFINPSFVSGGVVDKIVEVTSISDLQTISNKSVNTIYNVDGKTYRWDGSGNAVTDFIEVGPGTGVADSALKLHLPRNISLGGFVSGTMSFDGSESIKIDTTLGTGGKSTQYIGGDGTLHDLTQSAVGLSMVDNRSLTEYATTVTATLELKAPLANPTFTGFVSGLNKTMVGLGNVDNTADLSKPISTQTQTALNTKLDSSKIGIASGVCPLNTSKRVDVEHLPSYVDAVVECTSKAILDSLTNKAVDKIYVTTDDNKVWRWGGSTFIEITSGTSADTANTLATSRKIALDGLVSGSMFFNGSSDVTITTSLTSGGISTQYLGGDGSLHNLNADALGLTAINPIKFTTLTLPVSTATQTALDKKADLAGCTFTGTVSGITKEMVGLGDVENTRPNDYPISSIQKVEFDKKIDKDRIGEATVTVDGTTIFGICPLGTDGKVSSGYLPGFVDTITPVTDLTKIATPSTTAIYTVGGKSYRWDGSGSDATNYIEVGPGADTADKAVALARPITLSLGGVLSGSVQFDGSDSSVTLKATLSDAGGANTYLGGDGVVRTLDKTAVGLSYVDDQSLTAYEKTVTAALSKKAPLDSPTFTGTVYGITKAMIDGIDHVDNTSDWNKPLSYAATAGLKLKLDKSSSGIAGGVCPLNSAKRVNVEYLPSYVDEVVEKATETELATLAAADKVIDKIYVTTDKNKVWRWTGTRFIEITSAASADTATTLATSRRLTLSGSVDGFVDFNGSADVTFTTSLPGGTSDKQYFGGDNKWHTLDASALNLGDVAKYSLSDLPIPTLTQAELDLKAPSDNPTFTGEVSGITKKMVGLEFVDNTPDTGKPISTKAQLALDGKLNKALLGAKRTATDGYGVCPIDYDGKVPTAYIHGSIDTIQPVTDLTNITAPSKNTIYTVNNKSYRWDGSGSAATNYIEVGPGVGTSDSAVKLALKSKIELTGLVSGSVWFDGDPNGTFAITTKFADAGNSSPSEYLGSDNKWHTLDKTAVGLGSVENTSPEDLPVSTATQNVLNKKAPLDSPTFTGTVNGITKAMVGLGQVDNTADSAKPVSSQQQQKLDKKVDISAIAAATTDTVTGVCPLNAYKRVDASYLPSFVDEVFTVNQYVDLPKPGKSDKIYFVADDSKTYRWATGAIYVQVGPGTDTADSATKFATPVNMTITGDIEAQVTAWYGNTDLNIKAIIPNSHNLENEYYSGQKKWVTLSNKSVGLEFVDNTKQLPYVQKLKITGDVVDNEVSLSDGALSVTLKYITGLTAGEYNNSATANRAFTINRKGQVTAIGAETIIKPDWNNIQNKPTTVAGYAIVDVQQSNKWTIKTKTDNDDVLSNGDRILADTSSGSFTLKLPASPVSGDMITICDYKSSFYANNLTVSANGNNFYGIAADGTLTIDINKYTLNLIYTTNGWVLGSN